MHMEVGHAARNVHLQAVSRNKYKKVYLKVDAKGRKWVSFMESAE